MGNNGITRRRLPNKVEEVLGEVIALQLRIEGEVRAIHSLLDSSSAGYLQPRFENILDGTEQSREALIQHMETLKDLFKELRSNQ